MDDRIYHQRERGEELIEGDRRGTYRINLSGKRVPLHQQLAGTIIPNEDHQ